MDDLLTCHAKPKTMLEKALPGFTNVAEGLNIQ